MTSCARKTTSEGPLCPPSAAPAIFAPSTSRAMAQAPTLALRRAEDEVRSGQVIEGSSLLNRGGRRLFPEGKGPFRGIGPASALDGRAIANYLQEGYGGGAGSSAWPFPLCRKSGHLPLRITPKRAGVAAEARRPCPRSLGRSPRRH